MARIEIPTTSATMTVKGGFESINAMTAELYNSAGGYKPSSILAGLNLFDQFRWHMWYDDFITGPNFHMPDTLATWKTVPNWGAWTGLSSRAANGMVERNLSIDMSAVNGSWLQVVTGALATDFFHLTSPDASGDVPGATQIYWTGTAKKFALACRVVFTQAATKYGVGVAQVDTDPNTILDDVIAPPGVYIKTVGGVATVHIRNWEYVTPKSATLPTTITYNTTYAYEFELLYDGAGTFAGQYRTYTTASGAPGSWVSLGSVSLAGWQMTGANMYGSPWFGVKNTTAGESQLGVDYLLFAAER